MKLPTNENGIIRPRIDKLLEEGMRTSLIVVTASAGYGKTQAVAHFLEQSKNRGVWHQFTPLDNLQSRFWESFVHTISLHQPDMAKKLLQLGFPETAGDFLLFLQIITDELYVDNQFVAFVLDDFHLIENEKIIRFLQDFFAVSLENICFVVITRNPDLSVFKAKTFVISSEDLRFTLAETKQLLARKKNTAKEEIEKIHDYTSGWPLALGLINIRVDRTEHKMDKELSQSSEVLFRLIDKDVFSVFTQQEQMFLTLISNLNFFPRKLLIEIGRKLEVNTLAIFVDNMFVRFDQKADEYYLHHIFLDFLNQKHYLLDEAKVKDVYELAGDWCFENNFFVDAIENYKQSNNIDKIAQVIQGFNGMRQPYEDANLYINYINSFSDDVLEKHFMCRIVYAMLLLNNLDLGKAKNQIELVKNQLSEVVSEDRDKFLGETFIAAGLISMCLGDGEYVELFKKASALLPNGSRYLASNLELIEYGNALTIVSSEAGAIEKSVNNLFEAMPYVSDVLGGVAWGAQYLASAEANFLQAKFNEAIADAYKAIYVAEEKEEYDVINNALFLLMRIYVCNGSKKELTDTLNWLQKNSKRQADTIQYVPDVALGWFYSEIGEINKVAEWVLYSEKSSQPPISVDKNVLLQIRCLIEKKNYYKAFALVDKLQRTLEKRNTLVSIIYALVYRAIICYKLGDIEKSASALLDAYNFSKDNEIVMPFIESGHYSRSMLDYFSTKGIEGIPLAWLKEMHSKASTNAKRHAYLVSQYADIDYESEIVRNLSERETELLRHMSQGLTRDEIAQCMYISPHTVKSMTKNVYNKIGAINSADAIRIASVMKLV